MACRSAEEIRRKKETVTRLKTYRERIGLSQSELARESGVSVRMIQYYEQRRKDLEKPRPGQYGCWLGPWDAPWKTCWSFDLRAGRSKN
jgi:DNA-binding XRE family transcriptional regulator